MEPAVTGSPYPTSWATRVHFRPSGEVRTLQHPTAKNCLPDQATAVKLISEELRFVHTPGSPAVGRHLTWPMMTASATSRGQRTAIVLVLLDWLVDCPDGLQEPSKEGRGVHRPGKA